MINMGLLQDIGLQGSVNVAGTANQVYSWLLIIFMLLVIFGILFFIFFVKQFKHTMILKKLTANGRKIFYFDKFREFMDADKVIWWQLLKLKRTIPVGPAEVIEPNSKGKMVVEAYLTPTGDIIYSKDECKSLDPPDTIMQIKDPKAREKKIQEWQEEHRIVSANQPYTTNHRLILINQHKKALARRTKKWQDYILPIAGIAAVTILVVCLMIFYGDIAKPVLDMGDRVNTNQNLYNEQLRIMQEMQQDIQIIRDEQTGRSSEAPQ